jgi:hypothetical protein
MQYKLPFIILVISVPLSLVAIAIIPVYHEASAKECNNNNDDGSSCSDKQDSNSNNDGHDNTHSNSDGDDGGDNGAKQQKDKTPFVLAQPMPFP